MGVTPKFGLPYPEPTDLLRNVATAIRVLAETIGDRLDPNSDGAVIGLAESPSTFTAGGATAVNLPGGQHIMAGFTFDGVTLTRTGPARTFTVHGQAGVSISSPGTSSLSTFLQILGNGSEFASSSDQLAVAAETLTGREVVHTVTSSVRLVPGDTISLRAGGSHAGGVTSCALRVYPVGPRESA